MTSDFMQYIALVLAFCMCYSEVAKVLSAFWNSSCKICCLGFVAICQFNLCAARGSYWTRISCLVVVAPWSELRRPLSQEERPRFLKCTNAYVWLHHDKLNCVTRCIVIWRYFSFFSTNDDATNVLLQLRLHMMRTCPMNVFVQARNPHAVMCILEAHPIQEFFYDSLGPSI